MFGAIEREQGLTAHIQQPKSDVIKEVLAWLERLKKTRDYQRLSPYMGLDRAVKWQREFARQLQEILSAVYGKRLNSEQAYKHLAGAPFGDNFTLLKGFEQQEKDTAAEVLPAKEGEENKQGRDAEKDVSGGKFSWPSTPPTKKVNRTQEGVETGYGRVPMGSSSSFLEGSSRQEHDPEADKKKILELRREAHSVALWIFMEKDDCMERVLLRSLRIYLLDCDNHLGNAPERPVYSESGIDFSALRQFLEGELERKSVLAPCAEQIANITRHWVEPIVQFVKRISVLRAQVKEQMNLDLAGITKEGGGDVLFELVVDHCGDRERGAVNLLSPDKRFEKLHGEIEKMNGAAKKHWESAHHDESALREIHKKKLRRRVSQAVPEYARKNEKALLAFFMKNNLFTEKTQGNETEGKPQQWKKETKWAKEREEEESIEAFPQDIAKKEASAGQDTTSWRGRGNRGGRRGSRGRGRGDRGRGRGGRGGPPRPAPPPPPATPAPPMAEEMESFRVEVGEMPKKLATPSFTVNAEQDEASSMYETIRHDPPDEDDNAYRLSQNTLQAEVKIKGQATELKALVGIDTQSAVSMISGDAVKSYSQMTRKAARPRMNKGLRDLAKKYEQGITLRGIGGKQKLEGRVAYLDVRYGNGKFTIIPFLIVGKDMLPRGTDGIIGNHAIQFLFSEQEFGRLVFRPESAERHGDGSKPTQVEVGGKAAAKASAQAADL